MRLSIFILFMLSVIKCHAQHNKPILFGGDYTYIEFVISKKNIYPMCFAVITNNDTIKVDTSNVDAFTTSVFSSCKNSPISDNAYYKAFEMIYGKKEQVFNSCLLFISDFNNKLNRLKCTLNMTLTTGECVSIRYFNIIGVFLRLGDDFLPETLTSIGLPEKNIPKDMVIPISVADYYRTKKNFLIY